MSFNFIPFHQFSIQFKKKIYFCLSQFQFLFIPTQQTLFNMRRTHWKDRFRKFFGIQKKETNQIAKVERRRSIDTSLLHDSTPFHSTQIENRKRLGSLPRLCKIISVKNSEYKKFIQGIENKNEMDMVNIRQKTGHHMSEFPIATRPNEQGEKLLVVKNSGNERYEVFNVVATLKMD
ncbi:hypothetical protein SNEBB_000702 [Seison nebaliae]|nr:hypothetical protein SNEBB_000702 [Seison nebaliae]